MLGGQPLGAAPLGGGDSRLTVSGALVAAGAASANAPTRSFAHARLDATAGAHAAPQAQALYDALLAGHAAASAGADTQSWASAALAADAEALAALHGQALASADAHAFGRTDTDLSAGYTLPTTLLGAGASFAQIEGGPAASTQVFMDGVASADLLAAPLRTAGLRASGLGEFAARSGKTLASLLTASGAGQVHFQAVAPGDDEGLFDARGRATAVMAGAASADTHTLAGAGSTGVFFGSALQQAALHAQGVAVALAPSRSWQQGRLFAAGRATATAASSPKRALTADLTAHGQATAAVPAQRYGSARVQAHGQATLQAPTFARTALWARADAQGAATFSPAGRANVYSAWTARGAASAAFGANTVRRAAMSAAGVAAAGFQAGNRLFPTLPHAADATMRPYEIRALERPYEERKAVWR